MIKYILLSFGLLFLMTSIAGAGSAFRFGGNHEGFLALPKGTSPRYPAVILVHDWWGLDQQIKLDANRLADKNFVVLAVDLYKGKVTKDLSEANRWKEALIGTQEINILKTAFEALSKHPRVDRNHIGLVGYGMGADQAMRYALTGAPLKALVLLYGNPTLLPVELKKINGAVLAVFGDEDKTQSSKVGLEFDLALTEAHIEHVVKVYPNSRRGFADTIRFDTFNPKTGPEAQKDIGDFLAKYLMLRF